MRHECTKQTDSASGSLRCTRPALYRPPARDHQIVLSGILWALRAARSAIQALILRYRQLFEQESVL